MKFSPAYEKLFEEHVYDFKGKIDANPRYKDKKFALFYPMIGKHFFKNRDIMFVGRAANTWDVNFDIKSSIRKVVQKSIDSSQPVEDGCPIDWVNEYWDDKSWRIRYSSFWQIIYKIIQEKYNDNDETWNQRMAWSNLFKIAPEGGGNPSDADCNLMRDTAAKLVQQEISEWRPKNLVFITGKDWMEWDGFRFLPEATINWQNNPSILGLGNYNGSKIIITCRPEGKKQRPFIDEIIGQLV